jgi:NAD(P)-dependent dehydrogenase (short-subunit alcohol dehydrogenase family)
VSSQFAGQTVVVAGGTGALGSAISEAFVRAGATVVTTFHTASAYQTVSEALGVQRARLEGEQVDVTDETAVRRLADRVLEGHGRVDALVNAVGGFVGGVKLWDLEAAELDRMLALNLRSVFSLARAFVPVFLKQGRGSIVNVVAHAAIDHPAGASAYAASKAGALALGNSLAAELTGTGIRANCVLPRIIDTPANRQAMPTADFAKWTKPQGIAELILFLCSDAARAVHGAAIPV